MIIRQAAFTGKDDKFLKGGLHCHTTRSDGAVSPEETIRMHAAHGYDFLALTDHRFYNFRNYAPETGVLIIPGMEIDANINSGIGMCYHTVVLGPAQDKNGYAQDERVPSGSVANAEEFQPFVDDALKRGNIAFYCHPDWSSTPARAFEDIKGYFAMEIWNTGCVQVDNMDVDNGYQWDELLSKGRRINCVAVDDGHAACQHCGGWVMVNAEKDIDSIEKALTEGRFYASTGPEIYDFYLEDGKVYAKTSPCRSIRFCWGLRPSAFIKAPQGETITEASANLNGLTYVRVVVEDENGMRAWSNPIYLDKQD